MPLKSKAQLRKFAEMVKQGKMSQNEFQKWLDDTPQIDKLPDRAESQDGIKNLNDLRRVAKTKTIK